MCDIIRSMHSHTMFNSQFYNFHEFLDLLYKFQDNEIEVNDEIILPYYLFAKSRYELYNYEIRTETIYAENLDDYILNRTTKSNIKDVDILLQLKYKNLFLEKSESESCIKVSNLISCIEYIIKSTELKNIIISLNESNGEFKQQNLYFEFY